MIWHCIAIRKSAVHIAVAMSRPDRLVETLGVQRDRDRRCQRQPRDRLAVRTDLVETSMIATDWRAPAFQFSKPTEICLDAHDPRPAFSSRCRIAWYSASHRSLSIPRRVRARLKIQEHGQLADSLSRQWLRRAKHMKVSSAMMHRTRNGVLGAAQKKSGRPRRKQADRHQAGRIVRGARVTRVRSWSDMAQHDFPRTPPANRHEIADPAADHQPCRTTVMTQEAIRVEDRPRKQAVSILAGHQLAAMQVPGQDEVVAGIAGCLPDSRVVRAQDADMPIDVRRGVRAGDRDHSLADASRARRRHGSIARRHAPRPRGRGPCRSGGRGCRQWQEPVRRRGALPTSVTQLAQLGGDDPPGRRPAAPTSGLQRVTASRTCRHSVSERPFLR